MVRSPRRAAVLLASTVLVALLLAAAGLAPYARGEVDPRLAAGIVVATALLSLRTIRVFSQADLSLADVGILAGALFLPLCAVVPLAGAARLVGEVASRRPSSQVLRNVAAGMVSGGAASLAFRITVDLIPGPLASAETIPAALLAGLAFVAAEAAQLVALAAATRSVASERRSLAWVLSTARSQLLWILGGVVALEIARIEPLFLLPIVPLFIFGFEDDHVRYAAVRRARVLETLVDISRAVGTSLDPIEVFRAVYARVRRSIDADAFYVVIGRRDEDTLLYRFVVEGERELEPRRRPKPGTATGLSIDEERPILMRDVERERPALGLERNTWGTITPRSMMVAPLRIRGSVVGAISVRSTHQNAYDESDLELFGTIANEAAIAIERAELYDRTSALSRRLVDLHRTGVEMASAQDTAAIAQRLGDAARALLGSSAVAIYLDDGDPQSFAFAYRAGPSQTEVPRLAKALPLTTMAVAEGTVEIPDSAHAPDASRRMIETSGHRAVVIHPLRAAGDLVGLMFATWIEPHAIADEERELMALLGGMGATALRSARLYSELDEAYLTTVQTLMTTIQARDGYREDHQLRVAADAVALGERLALPASSLRALRYASLFHSIGKIAVPQEILSKPTPLTPDEERTVREHPILGARILEGIRFLEDVVPIVRHANERWDGSGYPDGLAYEAIPYEARILEIVLTYHSMIADRPYRRALDQRTALDEVRLLAGSRSDPGLVDEFVRMIEERGDVADGDRQVREGARELTVLAEITPQFSTLLDLKQLLDRVLASLARHWSGSRPVILLRDERTEELVVRAVGGDPGATVSGLRLARGHGLSSWVFDQRRSVIVDDAQNDPRYVGADDSGAVMMVPLINEGRAIGVLSVTSHRVGAYSQRDLTLLQAVGAQIAAAIEVAELHERLKRAANTDALTGLHNYRYFYDRLEEEISRAERRGTSVSVAYFDIDGLKSVNDSHGHLAGDAVLRTLGTTVEAHLRQEDVPARYGGDEFAIVMPETEHGAAEHAVERLMKLLDRTPISLGDGRSIGMPARSWGVATFPSDGQSASDLVNAADVRAYERKRVKA